MSWLGFKFGGLGVHFPRQGEDFRLFVWVYKLILGVFKYPKCDSNLKVRDDFVFLWNVRMLKRGIRSNLENPITFTLPEIIRSDRRLYVVLGDSI